jgi:ABC-2 type transport system ATP-binding protein
LLISFKNKGMTLIVSSHILAELEDYSTEMLVMKNGELIEKSVLHPDTSGRVKRSLFKATGSNLSSDTVEILQRSFPAIDNVELKFNELTFTLNEEVTKQHEILSFLVRNGVAITEFSEVKRNLQAEYLKTIKSN